MLKQRLIILHGWNGSRESWEKFIGLAKSEYEVHFISLPCFDGLECPKVVWGVQEYVDYVFNEIEKINKQTNDGVKSILLAHSFGGQIATVLMAQHPNLVSRLVLSGAAVIRVENKIKKIFLMPVVWIGRCLKKSKLRGILKVRKIVYKLIGGHDYVEATGIKAEIFKKIISEDVSEFAKQIEMPVTIVWGENDTYTPLRQGNKLAEMIGHSKLYVKKGGRHGLHIACPEWVLDKIKLD